MTLAPSAEKAAQSSPSLPIVLNRQSFQFIEDDESHVFSNLFQNNRAIMESIQESDSTSSKVSNHEVVVDIRRPDPVSTISLPSSGKSEALVAV